MSEKEEREALQQKAITVARERFEDELHASGIASTVAKHIASTAQYEALGEDIFITTGKHTGTGDIKSVSRLAHQIVSGDAEPYDPVAIGKAQAAEAKQARIEDAERRERALR